MSYRASATDANHGEIQAALRRIPGVAVRDVHHHRGLGCDLLVTFRGRDTWFVEVKDGAKPPSARKLTDAEQSLERQVGGRFVVVESKAAALSWALGALSAQVTP